jgi:hypothetical protein
MSALTTRVFWQGTAENMLGAAAAGAGSVLGLHVAELLTNVPWYAVLSGGGIGALMALLGSLGSLRVGNGTASYNPNIVAEPQRQGPGA